MRYTDLSGESVEKRILYTGWEMAIRAYNSERNKKEKHFLKPIVLWLDGVPGGGSYFQIPQIN